MINLMCNWLLMVHFRKKLVLGVKRPSFYFYIFPTLYCVSGCAALERGSSEIDFSSSPSITDNRRKMAKEECRLFVYEMVVIY